MITFINYPPTGPEDVVFSDKFRSDLLSRLEPGGMRAKELKDAGIAIGRILAANFPEDTTRDVFDATRASMTSDLPDFLQWAITEPVNLGIMLELNPVVGVNS